VDIVLDCEVDCKAMIKKDGAAFLACPAGFELGIYVLNKTPAIANWGC